MNDVSGMLLCDDLLFSSRVVGTAKALGLSICVVKNSAELPDLLANSTPACVILDLNAQGLNIQAAAQWISRVHPRPTLIGYGSHVDTATLKKARDAGCDLVWPRSKFVDELAAALPQWFRAAEAPS